MDSESFEIEVRVGNGWLARWQAFKTFEEAEEFRVALASGEIFSGNYVSIEMRTVRVVRQVVST